jgi:hypothetical protein
MNSEEKPDLQSILVAKVLDEYTLVINRGSNQGVKEGQRFLIYELSNEEVKDPATEESLGYLEIVKGIGKVTHVQDRLSTLVSVEEAQGERRIIKRRTPFSSISFLGGGSEEEIITPAKGFLPFADARPGNRARPI